MTIAERYNAGVFKVLPDLEQFLRVEQDSYRPGYIEEVVLARGEMYGSMASAILAFVLAEADQ